MIQCFYSNLSNKLKKLFINNFSREIYVYKFVSKQ